MGHINMLTLCHAEMLKSGHAVVLTWLRALEWVPEQVLWFLLVVVVSCF